MEPLGLRFGSVTSERSAHYILSLPAEAPEYFTEVSDSHRRTCEWDSSTIIPPKANGFASILSYATHFKRCRS